MKRLSVVLLMLCAAVCGVFCASLAPEREPQSFDSTVMLDNWDFDVILDNPSVMDGYEIALVTTTKGDPVYTWFGHSGLEVTYPNGESYFFDYGLFTYNSSFYRNFAMGRLWYSMSASRLKTNVIHYDEENRTMRKTVLDLSPEAKYAVINFLVYNARPENREYLYHYYKDNCATRIRDIIDYATDGRLREWAKQSDFSSSYRREAGRALETDPLWDWLLNFLQGGRIDVPADLWDAMFLPDVLEQAVIGSGIGTPAGTLVDNTLTDPRPATRETYSLPGELLVPCLVCLLLCAVFAVLARLGLRRAYGIFGFVVYLILGILGLVLFFISLFTDHDVAWFNENLALCNPVLLLFAVSNLRFALRPTELFERLRRQDTLMVILGGVLILLKIALPETFGQHNLQQILSLLPLYCTRAFVSFGRKSRERA